MRASKLLIFLALWSATGWLAAVTPASAWNGPGHMVAARIAYEHLTPSAREDVDSLLTNHPEFNMWVAIVHGVVPSSQESEAIFMLSATWPDDIRGDQRFYDDVKGETEKPKVDGYPDMARHTNWHFFDIPFSQDHTKLPSPSDEDPHNAVTMLTQLTAEISQTPDRDRKSYDLPWIVHITGDIHQPLHSASRYSKLHPKGDLGGNSFILSGGRKLHSYWDSAVATGYDYTKPEHFAHDLATAFKYVVPALNADSQSLLTHHQPEEWSKESFGIAKAFVYTVGAESKTKPPTPSSKYNSKAKKIAGQRVVLAGLRLADALNAANLK